MQTGFAVSRHWWWLSAIGNIQALHPAKEFQPDRDSRMVDRPQHVLGRDPAGAEGASDFFVD